jgi:PPP family 3-phenylpropionic acid transporter
VLQVLRRPTVRWFFASVFLTVLAHSSLYAFFSLYLVDLGYAKGAVGALWAVAVAVEVLFFWTQGHWFRRWSASQWLVIAAGAAALRFAAMAAFGASAVLLVLAQMLHAFSFAAHHAACIATIDRHFAGALRGRGQGLYSMIGYGLSGVVGGLAGGALSERFGFEVLFGAAAAVALLGLACAARSRTLDRN